MTDNHDDESLNLVFHRSYGITLPALTDRTLRLSIGGKSAVSLSQAKDALALRTITIRGFLR
jgi:hypothetical protein